MTEPVIPAHLEITAEEWLHIQRQVSLVSFGSTVTDEDHATRVREHEAWVATFDKPKKTEDYR